MPTARSGVSEIVAESLTSAASGFMVVIRPNRLSCGRPLSSRIVWMSEQLK